MSYNVIDVKPVGHLHLKVTFKDGLSGDVVLRKSHLTGVFSSLQDPSIFAKVSCSHGFVEWPGDIDLAPDAMYDEVKKNGVWELV